MKRLLILIEILLLVAFILDIFGFYLLEVILDDERGLFLMNLSIIPLCIVLGLIIPLICTNKQGE